MTDAILAMGYKDGKYQFGQQEIEVRGDQAWVAGTSTLTGSVATMQRSVTKFLKYVKHMQKAYSPLQPSKQLLVAWCDPLHFLVAGTPDAAWLKPSKLPPFTQLKLLVLSKGREPSM